MKTSLVLIAITFSLIGCTTYNTTPVPTTTTTYATPVVPVATSVSTTTY